MFWIACPDAPLTRLSIVENITILFLFLVLHIDISQQFEFKTLPLPIVELILSIRPQISDPNVKSTKSIWLHYRTNWNFNLKDIDTAVEYNEKIFNIIKKFLNMIGQEPYYKSNFIDANYLNRRKRGGV